MKSCARAGGAILLLLSMAAFALAVSGSYDWRWVQPEVPLQWEDENHDIDLTDRNGSRAAVMYSQGDTNVYARAIFEAGNSIWVLPYTNGEVDTVPVQPDSDAAGERPCVIISTGRVYVGALWYQKDDDLVWYCKADWADSYEPDWDTSTVSDGAYNAALALGEGYTLGDAPCVYACYRAHPTDTTDGVWFQMSINGSWGGPVQISTDPADQIAVLADNPISPVVAYHFEDNGTHKIRLWRSWDFGNDETWEEVEFDEPLEDVAQPSIASWDGVKAAVCWVKAPENGDPTEGGKVWVSWRGDYGFNEPVAVGSYSSDPDLVYNAPTMAIVPTNSSQYTSNLVIVSELKKDLTDPNEHWLSATSGLFGDDDILWRGPEHYMPYPANVADENANPCVDACIPSGQNPKAYCFYTAAGAAHRALYRLDADYVPSWLPLPPAQFDGIGRRLWLEQDGTADYATRVGANVHFGQALEDGYLQPILVSGGGLPALALDGDGNRWVSYIRDDTVWTMTGDGSYEVTFAGSSSAVPGQPNIVCYPGQANGVYVGNVVFTVSDTAGGSGLVMYARVDTGGVVLDTIASAQNLGDSLPCVSVYKSDTLVATFSRGDSVMGTMLCDYGPGTSGQPPAWTSPNLVTANGYHAMSRFDDNGTVLNVVWSRNNGSNYAVQRATCDLATTAFGNWSTMATPGDTGSALKTNPVFGGLGVTCWQEMDDGKWIIKGFVRGEEETFVANDTDAYHPHCVAESSSISPSIQEVRAHILYTAGVVFEVDSGVFDTGETRYVCCSLDVSNATSDATKSNNGSKFLRKNGSDSLFSVYSDLDNAVVFAWSANGDTWQRSVIASGRDYPAIAEDSSGKRWVVMRKPGQGILPPIQEAYYRSGSSWTGPETLYAVTGTTLGPASLSGSSYTQSGIAYAGFISTAYDSTQSVILAKFDGTNVSTYTVATGTTLGDPCITVEPYLADSDRVHIVWEDNGIVYYRMDTDGRSSSIAGNWTQAMVLSDAQATSQHPGINSDADQIVVAWAQGSPADVYACKRSTDSAYNNWESAANLSNTANDASDWPTVAMGDTVVVAWEEARTGGSDYDILACIDFCDTLNIADNATYSTYPHILFQNKASGDTAIPYLHTIWAETPEAEYYEVGYNKLNLKQATGEGQQSAGTPPIPVKPSLSACRPNPFRDRTQISYALPAAGNVSLRVYDVTGRTVRTLASGHQKAGSYSVSWDSKDSRGRQVPRGVYFYRLDTPGFRSVKKAVVAR